MSADRITTEWQKYKLGLTVFYVLLLYRCNHVEGLVTVEISPSGVAPVCQVGDQLELTCTSSGGVHRWEFTIFPENMTHTTAPILSVGTSGSSPPLMISNSMIIFSRLSGQDVQPLVSRAVVSPVSSGLDETVVNCFEGVSSTVSVATTTIRIVHVDPGQLELNIQSDPEQFSIDGVTVNLEWTLLNSQVDYQQLLQNVSINVDPPLDNVMFTGNTSVQLILSYNTPYNVSITQHSTCQLLIQTTFILLNYSKCADPMELTNARAIGYVDPALEGHIITFSCLPGQTLNGSNQSTCMGNGKWEPDPRDVECILGPDTQATASTTDSNTTLPPTDCIPQETCSSPKTDPPQNIIGIVLGIIFGILVVVAAVAFVIILIFIWSRKAGNNRTGDSKHQHNIEIDTHDDKALVYADIGHQPAPVKSNPLLLDDNRVEYALLDHTEHKASTLQESSIAQKPDNNCPSVNLDNLLIQLQPQVCPKWYQFGEAAGIEKEALDKIAEQCQTPEQCIVELFDYWLRFSAEPPTWKTVADVLKAIKLTELGHDIEAVYTTGTLPIVVDMNHVPTLDVQEEEPPPPLPARSGNLYIDTPSHTVQITLQGPTSPRPRAAPPPSNEMSAPALPPKPPRNRSAISST